MVISFRKKNLHFTWFGGESYVDSSWYSLWDDDTIYLAILYERRSEVEKIHEIIELGFDSNNNGLLDDGEIGLGAQYTDEGAGSPNVPQRESFNFCKIRVPDTLGWEILEDSNFGLASLRKSETHVVFEMALSKEVFESDDSFSFGYRISSFMYGETAKIFDNIHTLGIAQSNPSFRIKRLILPEKLFSSGDKIPLSIVISNTGTTSNAIVDGEILGPKAHNEIRYFSSIPFETINILQGQTHTYTYTWEVPSDAPAGIYFVNARIRDDSSIHDEKLYQGPAFILDQDVSYIQIEEWFTRPENDKKK